MQNLNKTNIRGTIQDIESSIEETCSQFSYRSIVERALVDVCVLHYYYLDRGTRTAFLLNNKKERLNIEYLLSSLMQTPHYVACFSTLKSINEKPIPEAEYSRLGSNVGLWLFLTEIMHTGFLRYFEFLNVNQKTFEIEARINVKRFRADNSAFRNFFIDYSTYEAARIQSITPRIFSLALEDVNEVDNLVLAEKGFRPSSVLRALYALAWEFGEIFKVPETYVKNHGYQDVSRKFCDVLMDFPLEYCRKVLEKRRIGNMLEIFNKVTLTPEISNIYIQSRRTKKRAQNIFMHSYPLWDYPLLKVDQNYVTHPILLTQCLQELVYKFITSSESALARHAQSQHEILVKKVCSILKEEGFQDIKQNIRIRVQGCDKAQFDIVAIKKPYLLNVECKTKRVPWRTRMFFDPIEMRKEGSDFIEENKLSEERWSKKLRHLSYYARSIMGDNQHKLASMVVTDTPTPASVMCKYIDIVWIMRLEDYIHKKLKIGK